MNAKKCKELRKLAMSQSPTNEPLRQLVQYAQIAYDAQGKRRTAIAAVNNPESFRGRYRNHKSGRTIDRKRLVGARQERMVTETSTRTGISHPDKETFWQKLRRRFAIK